MSQEADVFLASPESIDPENFLVAKYRVKSRLPLKEAGKQIAVEESIGTWTEIKTTTLWAKLKLAAKVFKTEEENNVVYIAYPIELFDAEAGIANLLSIVAGNLFGLSSLERVRLIDIQVPRRLAESYDGPKFGIEGIRKLVETHANPRPHLGVIVKPKVGLNPKETANVVYEAAIGGADFIKDDETLVNQSFCILEERVSKVMEALDKVEQELGRKPLYAVNITSSYRRMVK
ncbi:MAG: ribulose 1,5-bisphosphate carboxylase large subunit, partial [Candidatus Methanomethylicota archaeon]